jgi:hypothetical protein
VAHAVTDAGAFLMATVSALVLIGAALLWIRGR